MARQMKQTLTAEARKAASSDSFISSVLFSQYDVNQCSQAQFLEIVANINDLCDKISTDKLSAYVQMVYQRMLKLLSQKVSISSTHITNVARQFVYYHPDMAIMTLDDLTQYGLQMEQRSLVVHFDMSGSMSGSGFVPLVQNIVQLCENLQVHGMNVYVSLFGGGRQEAVHRAIGGRLLTLNEFIAGNYQPGGRTAFCPSFERTKQFATVHDAIIVSDGEFTDDISQLVYQEHCKTVFFVAPPWSSAGVEKIHAAAIAKCLSTTVPYIGIASDRYTQMNTIIEEFIGKHLIFAHLPSYIIIGTYVVPSVLLAPTQMIKVLQNCISQGEDVLNTFTKKILGLFHYLEETAKLNFERCIRGEEFRNTMSLITPLTKTAMCHLETSNACRQLYGYLVKILDYFSAEQKKLIDSLSNNNKAKAELTKLWQSAMSFSERTLIIEQNEKQYGHSIGYLNVRIASLTCSCEMLSAALIQLKTVYSPNDLDLLSLILDILSNSKISDRPTEPADSNIIVWRKPDGTVDLLSILRLLPSCLRQLQHSLDIPLDNDWTLQPMTAIRLAWIMDVTGRSYPDFITQALPTLVVPNKFLTDLDQDENRSAFWIKIIRELAPKVGVSTEQVKSSNQILTVHVLKRFLLQLTDSSITYDKPVYENASAFIDTNDPMAWCVFVDNEGNRLDARTGKAISRSLMVTEPSQVAAYYSANLSKRGAVVRPRYLTLLDNPKLPDGAIELYDSSARKDVDILRDQLMILGGSSYSVDQINAHLYTLRDRLKSIPFVVRSAFDTIKQTVEMAKASCQGASIPMEKVKVNIPRSTIIDYIVSHCEDLFVAGALRAFCDYAHLTVEPSMSGVSELDYAIDYGQKTLAPIVSEAVPFAHLDKPGVQEYVERQCKQLARMLRTVMQPPAFHSVSSLIKQSQKLATNQTDSGMADLESLAATSNGGNAVSNQAPASLSSSRLELDENLFTCPITLDIMDNPATTTPCGHMFEMDAINGYLMRSSNVCPICRATVTNVTPNYTFKSVIEAWLAQKNA
ncbi:unnamed protein product [Rotaria sp. Silwood2]|nr:unnamed protein product [Rotaria sp. Silwood2]CAF4416528.1 unnamed protein product [Rotaria sp. Silwood2]